MNAGAHVTGKNRRLQCDVIHELVKQPRTITPPSPAREAGPVHRIVMRALRLARPSQEATKGPAHQQEHRA